MITEQDLQDTYIKFCTNFDLGTTFQDPATPIAEAIIDLHHYITFYLVLVLAFVIVIFLDIFLTSKEIFGVFNKRFFGLLPFVQTTNVWSLRKLMFQLNKVNHATILETIWTIIPSFILVLIAVPSLSLLYSMDEILYPEVTVKVTGYQWYWSYEIVHLPRLAFAYEKDLVVGVNFNPNIPYDLTTDSYDSYMVNNDWMEFGHRLLTTDTPLILPSNVHIRILVTAADVLHSWAVPALGVKIDAVPGRLNQGSIYLKRDGIFYGQCSELCGVNHGFMPIVVISDEYDTVIISYLEQIWTKVSTEVLRGNKLRS